MYLKLPSMLQDSLLANPWGLEGRRRTLHDVTCGITGLKLGPSHFTALTMVIKVQLHLSTSMLRARLAMGPV